MSHMVIFQTPDGNPGYNQFESLDEAVRFVEKLRNEQSVETARMFALEEVKFDFKPYFKVELDPPMVGPAGSTTGPVSAPTPPPAPPSAPTPPPSPAAPPTFAPAAGQPAPPSPPPAPPTPPAFAEPPAPGPEVKEPDSPVGGEPATVGAPPPPTFMAPPSPPEGEQTQTRRGLFGR